MMTALRILVVDDDAMIGLMLGELLQSMGHNVCAIEMTEADAVSAAIRCKPDLMIVDVRLRDQSGISAVEKINRKQPTPHVFATGDVSAVRTSMPGAVVIEKPFSELDVAGAIQQAMDNALEGRHSASHSATLSSAASSWAKS